MMATSSSSPLYSSFRPASRTELCLPAGAQRGLAQPDLGCHTTLQPRGQRHGHHELQLPGVHFLPAVVEKKIPDTPGQHWESQEELLPSGQ